MVIVSDINTAWRRMPFEALARFQPVLGLEPMDRWIALKAKRALWGSSLKAKNGFATLRITLPFSWATHGARNAMRSIWEEAKNACDQLGREPSAVVITSPHYVELVRQIPESTPSFYYCSDDFLNYEGWARGQMAEQELELLSRVRHSFFVSEALRTRAIEEYGISAERTSVSENATSKEFIERVGREASAELLRKHPGLKPPIAGVIGTISDRLDLDLLYQVASLDEVGAVALIGPVNASKEKQQLDRLLRHPKVVPIGNQPRDLLPTWHQVIDVGLIPYRNSPFNYYCSPMRLFDHLASGRPIVATSACPQVLEYSEHVAVTTDSLEFLSAIRKSLRGLDDSRRIEAQLAAASLATWSERAAFLNEMLNKKC